LNKRLLFSVGSSVLIQKEDNKQHQLVPWELPFLLHEFFPLELKVYSLVFLLCLQPVSTCISRNREAVLNNHQKSPGEKILCDFSLSERI